MISTKFYQKVKIQCFWALFLYSEWQLHKLTHSCLKTNLLYEIRHDLDRESFPWESAKTEILSKYYMYYLIILWPALVFHSQAVCNTSSLYASFVCVCERNALKCELKWKIFAVRTPNVRLLVKLYFDVARREKRKHDKACHESRKK